ncbi:hypothetical protein DPEC_G00271670 [Dallia pectoralis]|uniref:Uncharacterized protein n=1 Tax=Dallia pectoralis TaxID=75939 RepID=A0ACC2FPP3_DALPE|nr:hypothetical protein DPEC_G00271670 [Dallia pectoralis]
MYLENKSELDLKSPAVAPGHQGLQGHQGRASLRATEAVTSTYGAAGQSYGEVAENFGGLRLLEGFSERRDSLKLQQSAARPPGNCVIHAEDGQSFNVVNFLKGKNNQANSSHTERAPLLRYTQDDSITYMTLYEKEETWDSSMELERRCRLGTLNLTDFHDNALLKLQVGGPFLSGMVDLTNEEYVRVQVEQTEEAGPRRRRAQTVVYNWTIPLHPERSDQIITTKIFKMLSSDPIVITVQAFLRSDAMVPLSMTHQSLYVTVETQVIIAAVILGGVYVLIIFELSWDHVSPYNVTQVETEQHGV